jgi:hypothetical protein
VAPASGGEAHAIAADFAVATAPVWSADGRLLLFSGRRTLTDPPTWWIVGRDGAAPVDTGARAAFEREGLLPSPGGFILPESWAADGTVLFSAALSDGTNIWSTKVLPDGRVSTPERLTNGTGLEAQPSGSPETTLAFTVLDTDVDLWTLPIDTAALRPTGPEEPVTRDAAMDAYPTLSADGSVVVFYSNRLGATNLWMREMATGAERVLAVDAGFPGVPVITRDGSRVLYEGRPQTKWFALPLSGAGASPANMSHLVCDDCHGIWDVTSDGKWSLTPRNGDHAIRVREAATGRTFEYLQAPDSNIGRLRLSPDDRWVTLTNRAGGFVQVVVAPFRPGSIVDQVDQKEWIPITDGNAVANAPAWSPDGRVIYYLGDTDGSVCVWGRRIDPATGRPVGDAVAVGHFHEARRSLSRLTLPLRGLGVARNRLVVSVVESTGSVWLSRPRPDRESARGQGSK